MLALRKRATQISTFRFGFETTPSGTAGVPINFNLGGNPIFPGDTIFVNIRNGTGAMTSMPGFATIGNTGGLYTGARVVQPGDTGNFTFTWSTNSSNMNLQAMVSGVSLGYLNGGVYSFATNSVTCNAPAISIPKNATVLAYYTTAGGLTATGRTLTPSDFTQALGASLTRQSHYKKYLADTTDDFTITWTGGLVDTTRISRVVVLGTT